jgi:hypothetical protein
MSMPEVIKHTARREHERTSRRYSCNAVDFYLRNVPFESRPRHCLSVLTIFVAFIVSCQDSPTIRL